MASTINSVNANTDTFAGWISITNQVAQTISNNVLTANTTEGVTGTVGTPYNAKLIGQFTANTIVISNTLSGPLSANITVQANVVIATGQKLFTVGELNAKGDVVIDTTSKIRLSDRTTTYVNTTGWLRSNTSTGNVYLANLAVKGTDLDPAEFILTANIGYATSTNSTYDVIVYDQSSSKWLRTRLTHLVSQEVDTLTLGTVNANSSGTVSFNANVNFGGTTSSLFVANTTARVGVGGITNPQAPLHVNGAIYATGDVTTYYTSDKRLKKDIVKIEDALEKVRWLNGVEFTWNKDVITGLTDVGPKPDRDVGLIAQDVEKVFPQAVLDRVDGYKAVDYTRLVPVLIEAIKELSYRVNILEAELEDKYRSSSR